MKILVVGYEPTSKYSGIFCANFCRALDQIKVDYDSASPNDSMLDHKGYDFYIGAGDELFRKTPRLVSEIKSMGGIAIDVRTKKLPNKPKTWIKSLLQSDDTKADYVLTHMKDPRANCFWIGQGLNDELLYPEQDDKLTIFVDHYMPGRNAKVQSILDQCQMLLNTNRNVRIWYHSSKGIVENVFVEDRSQYKLIPFTELSAYYRKTHVFLPTHRETQGIVAAEIGMCGGLTLLEPWMYPKDTIAKIPHEFCRNKIDWPKRVLIERNRDFTRMHYGVEAFAARIKTALDAIATREL